MGEGHGGIDGGTVMIGSGGTGCIFPVNDEGD
jgi:hypothetical protein